MMKRTDARISRPVAMILGAMLALSADATAGHPALNSAGSGAVYVTGALLESPCTLAMDSAWQEIALGAIPTDRLRLPGDTANSAAFTLRLVNCRREEAHSRDLYSGAVAWSPDEPAITVSFSASVSLSMPQYAAVTGASGVALKLDASDGREVKLNAPDKPVLLTPGQNALTYRLTMIRTPGPLRPGAWWAVLNFNTSYL